MQTFNIRDLLSMDRHHNFFHVTTSEENAFLKFSSPPEENSLSSTEIRIPRKGKNGWKNKDKGNQDILPLQPETLSRHQERDSHAYCTQILKLSIVPAVPNTGEKKHNTKSRSREDTILDRKVQYTLEIRVRN